MSSRSLGRELTVDDIDTSHPLQAKNGSKNPITIIKFVRRDLRNEVLQRRKLMKRFGVNATEQLTDENIILFRKAQDFAGANNAWTDQAVIYIRSGTNVFKISSVDDFPFFNSLELELFNHNIVPDSDVSVQHPDRHITAEKPRTNIQQNRFSSNEYAMKNNIHNYRNSDRRNYHSDVSAHLNLDEQRNSVSYDQHIKTLNRYNSVSFPSIEQVTENFINRKRNSAASSNVTQHNSGHPYKHNFSRINTFSNNHFNKVPHYHWGGGYAGDAGRLF